MAAGKPRDGLPGVRVLGFTGDVLRAYNGRDAIAIAKQERPDVIVLDLMMPEMSGFDVVAALQLHPETARIPILVVTATRVTAEDRQKLNGFVTAIMEKADFDRARFAAEIRRALSGRVATA